MSIYEEMVKAGVKIDSWQSDMYVPVNDITKEIISRYQFKKMVTKFRDNIDHVIYYDIPFAYDPHYYPFGIKP